MTKSEILSGIFIVAVFALIIAFVGVNTIILVALGVAAALYAFSLVKARQDRIDRGERV
jgi:hypothetical protein